MPIFGYSTDVRTLRARILPRSAGETVDADAMSIEDLGQPFNAMISGGPAAPAGATTGTAIAAAADHLRHMTDDPRRQRDSVAGDRVKR